MKLGIKSFPTLTNKEKEKEKKLCTELELFLVLKIFFDYLLEYAILPTVSIVKGRFH